MGPVVFYLVKDDDGSLFFLDFQAGPELHGIFIATSLTLKEWLSSPQFCCECPKQLKFTYKGEVIRRENHVLIDQAIKLDFEASTLKCPTRTMFPLVNSFGGRNIRRVGFLDGESLQSPTEDEREIPRRPDTPHPNHAHQRPAEHVWPESGADRATDFVSISMSRTAAAANRLLQSSSQHIDPPTLAFTQDDNAVWPAMSPSTPRVNGIHRSISTDTLHAISNGLPNGILDYLPKDIHYGITNGISSSILNGTLISSLGNGVSAGDADDASDILPETTQFPLYDFDEMEEESSDAPEDGSHHTPPESSSSDDETPGGPFPGAGSSNNGGSGGDGSSSAPFEVPRSVRANYSQNVSNGTHRRSYGSQ